MVGGGKLTFPCRVSARHVSGRGHEMRAAPSDGLIAAFASTSRRSTANRWRERRAQSVLRQGRIMERLNLQKCQTPEHMRAKPRQTALKRLANLLKTS